MELMFIVWFVGVVSNLPTLFGVTLAVLLATAFCFWFWSVVAPYTDKERAIRIPYAKKFYFFKTMVALAVCITATPTETTMKYMAGAYLVQSAYESDLMQEATPLAKRAVLNQLKSWAEDAPDLLNLLPQENKDVTTNQP